MNFLKFIVDKQKELEYTKSIELDSKEIDNLTDIEKEYLMLNNSTPYGWVNNLPVDTAFAKYSHSNEQAVQAINKLLRFDPSTKAIDTRNIKLIDTNNNIKKNLESHIYKVNEHGQRVSKRGSDYNFYLYDMTKNPDNTAVVIFLDGNVSNINSATFATFYYKGIGFKEKIDPNLSSSLLGLFRHVGKNKNGLKEPSVKEQAFVTVLTILKTPYTNSKGKKVFYEKKIFYIDDNKKDLMRELQEIAVDKNNGNFKGLMVKLANVGGTYSAQPIDASDLPLEVFGEKGRTWLASQVTKNGGYYALLKATVKTQNGFEEQDYVEKLFNKPENELRNAKGDVYQSANYFAKPFNYDEVMPDGNVERIKAFYGRLEAVMTTLPDGTTEPTGEVRHVPGVLQTVVEGNSLMGNSTQSTVPRANAPTQAYQNTQPLNTNVDQTQETMFQMFDDTIAPQQTQVNYVGGVVKPNTKPVGLMPPALDVLDEYMLTEDDLPF